MSLMAETVSPILFAVAAHEVADEIAVAPVPGTIFFLYKKFFDYLFIRNCFYFILIVILLILFSNRHAARIF